MAAAIPDKAALKTIFNKFDKDRSGSVDTAEMRAMIKALKIEMTDEKLKAMMKAADPDGSGTIDFEEFSTALIKQMKEGGGLADVFNQASNIFGWFNPFAMFSSEKPPEPPPSKPAAAKPPAAPVRAPSVRVPSPPPGPAAAPARAPSPPPPNNSSGTTTALVPADPRNIAHRLDMARAQDVMQPYVHSNGQHWEQHLPRAVAPIEKRIGGKKALTPVEADLLTDKYAPRAFADFSRNLSSTFAQVVSSGSYVGSPPRVRDKPIVSYEGALAGDRFHHNRKLGPSPTHVAHTSHDQDSKDIINRIASADNEHCGPWEVKTATGKHFLKDDPWESH